MCILISGCSFTQNPFADINKQGTVINPTESVTIQSKSGPVTIEYVAPTKRRIVWSGESREFNLLKSTGHAGVFAGTHFKQGPINEIFGIIVFQVLFNDTRNFPIPMFDFVL